MITKTDGYILPSEMGASYSTLGNILELGIVNRPQPDGVRDDSNNGYFQNIRLRYSDSGGTTGMERNNSLKFQKAFVQIQEDSLSALSEWGTFETTDEKTNGIKQVFSGSTSGIDLRTDRAILNSNFVGDGNAFSTYIDAIQIERLPDNPTTDLLESTGCHKASASAYEWTPFDENESASAYVFKELVARNSNVINAKTAESRTYPVIRATGGVS